MRNRILVSLLAVMLFGAVAVQAQTSCPTGYKRAEGFATQDPTAAIGAAFIYPMCIKNSDGSLLFQGNLLVQADITSKATTHLVLNTTTDSTQVRINSRSFTQATGDSIGFQSKPSQTVTTTGSVFGGQISPRLQSGIAAGNIIGLDVNSDLKGTAAGTVSGDVRGLNVELVTDDAGTRTISGNVTMLRFRAAFSATTISGKFVPIRIEKAESQTNSKQFDAVFELPSTNGAVWGVKGSDYSPSQPRAKIKVLINGTEYWLVAYAVEPT